MIVCVIFDFYFIVLFCFSLYCCNHYHVSFTLFLCYVVFLVIVSGMFVFDVVLFFFYFFCICFCLEVFFLLIY